MVLLAIQTLAFFSFFFGVSCLIVWLAIFEKCIENGNRKKPHRPLGKD